MSVQISHETVRSWIHRVNPTSQKLKLEMKTDLFDCGALDSFTVVELVAEIEKDMNVVFDYVDLRREHFENIESLMTFLQRKYKHS